MATMGKYCKAYLLKQFRQFNQWKENQEVNQELAEDSVVYLQENYVVTDGIYKDENIIFDNVTDDWKQFCHKVLEFEIPNYEVVSS
ncbi:hypothetical protein IQ247_28380 [Plectonema cf. radiosum LEGE 06105]|uniref:Uncharacterized protein n=1 Tax=Plectonema cf. radiosum LEGE 06105 TaxID=945769 RepID=A0A8J7F4W5_9CYAN|nr:hypothetical protein [Plectonema radiosum]MBE9216531.1 hypothetical protein [Plectonema cf. radiosum LEGE 06105]